MSNNEGVENLTGVPESALITVLIRAEESRRPDALVVDRKAVELYESGRFDFSNVRRVDLNEMNKLVLVLRCLEYDRIALDFCARQPGAVIVHIGCGLDTRYQRLEVQLRESGLAAWYDLDFPQIIDLRRELVGGEQGNYHLLSGSVLDPGWQEPLRAFKGSPFLFLAEGVFMYFEGDQARSLVCRLRRDFPSAELAFDTFSPLHIWMSRRQTGEAGLFASWGLWSGKTVEKWSPGIRFLGEWGFFDHPTHRSDPIRWMKPIEALIRTLRIFRFQLGIEPG